MSDIDDFYMEYDDLVEAGEIDPNIQSIDDFVESRIGDLYDRADLDLDR